MSEDPLNEKIIRLRAAREAVRRSDQELSLLLFDLFPVGAIVRWKRGHHVQVGMVTAHGYHDALMVGNSRTGAILKISVFDIIQSLDPAEEVTA